MCTSSCRSPKSSCRTPKSSSRTPKSSCRTPKSSCRTAQSSCRTVQSKWRTAIGKLGSYIHGPWNYSGEAWVIHPWNSSGEARVIYPLNSSGEVRVIYPWSYSGDARVYYVHGIALRSPDHTYLELLGRSPGHTSSSFTFFLFKVDTSILSGGKSNSPFQTLQWPDTEAYRMTLQALQYVFLWFLSVVFRGLYWFSSGICICIKALFANIIETYTNLEQTGFRKARKAFRSATVIHPEYCATFRIFYLATMLTCQVHHRARHPSENS